MLRGKRLSRAIWSGFNKEWGVAFVRQYGCRTDGAEKQCTNNQMRMPPFVLPRF